MLIMLIHVQVIVRELQSCNAHLLEPGTDEISVICASGCSFHSLNTDYNSTSWPINDSGGKKPKKHYFVINGWWASTIKGFSLKCIIKIMGACGTVHWLIWGKENAFSGLVHFKMNPPKLKNWSYNKSGHESNKIMIVLTATAGLQGTPRQIYAHPHLLNAS